jgi:hypothetical protein
MKQKLTNNYNANSNLKCLNVQIESGKTIVILKRGETENVIILFI